MADFVLGIDIGGTNLKFGLVTPNGEISHKNSFPTKDFSQPILFVEKLYDFLEKEDLLSKISGIGIGAPNGNFFHGTIDNAPNLIWKGIVPLVQLFEQKFGVKAILSNDANAAAYGEKIFGVGKKMSNFVCITLGTGLGSGLILDGKLFLGTNGFAGEFGHIRVDDGRLCKCGRKGCLETYASATGMMRSFDLWKAENPTSSLLKLEKVTPREIFQEAHSGDEFAQKIIDFTCEKLGTALADFACFSDPEAFVIFGGIVNSGGKEFIQKIKNAMEANLLTNYKDRIQVLRSGLNESDAGLLGAAALFYE